MNLSFYENICENEIGDQYGLPEDWVQQILITIRIPFLKKQNLSNKTKL